MVPGSDPLFGLNTLGGALPIRTKDGVSDPGIGLSATYGSSGRKQVQVSTAAERQRDSTGFSRATDSMNRAGALPLLRCEAGICEARMADDKTDIAFTTSYAYNTLGANGLQDFRLLAANYSSGYTFPDTTGNRPLRSI